MLLRGALRPEGEGDAQEKNLVLSLDGEKASVVLGDLPDALEAEAVGIPVLLAGPGQAGGALLQHLDRIPLRVCHN